MKPYGQITSGSLQRSGGDLWHARFGQHAKRSTLRLARSFPVDLSRGLNEEDQFSPSVLQPMPFKCNRV